MALLSEKRLNSIGIPRPLSTEQSAALLLIKEFTEKNAQFIRKYFGGLATVKSIRQARSPLLSTVPEVLALRNGHSTWEKLDITHKLCVSQLIRDLQCARFDMHTFFKNYLTNVSNIGISTRTPSLPIIPLIDPHNTIIFELSIDTGGGTTKPLGRFIDERHGQNIGQTTLLSEAHNITETFNDLYRAFGVVFDQLRSIMQTGIDINGKHYNF